MRPGEDYRPPEGWGADPLSEFLDLAHQNAFAVFSGHGEVYRSVELFDSCFLQARETLEQQRPSAAVFLLRTHAAFRAAARLALAAQLPEAYTVIRSVLETAVYALYIEVDPAGTQRLQAWCNRQDGEEARKRARKEFGFEDVMKSLRVRWPELCNEVRRLYDLAIDYGAHPNVLALFANASTEVSGTLHTIHHRYLNPGGAEHSRCLVTLLETAVTALAMFEAPAPATFQSPGLHRALNSARTQFETLLSGS